jgi:tRNA G18 (ribose-2'-O)-methylase SpoU
MEPPAHVRPPRAFLIISNIGKKQNMKELLISAAAFGVSDVLIAGLQKIDFDVIASHAFSKGPHPFSFRRFDNLDDCRQYLKEMGDISIVGVEIMNDASDVNEHPFTGDTAFLMGNEGTGLNKKQLEVCDRLVYIPQYGGGTASLNVCVAASILFQHFAAWAQYAERSVKGNLFVRE